MARVAVVGSGPWGMNLIRNFARLGALEAVCDMSPERLEKVREEFPGTALYSDYSQLLKDGRVEAVAVATPPAGHFRVAREALLAGKHAFVEKPMTLEVADSEELVRLSEEKGLVCMVGHLLLYQPPVEKLRELIASGELGELFYLTCTRIGLGKIRREENALFSLAPHDISVMLHLLNRVPEAVSCVGRGCIQDKIEDFAFCSLLFPGGVIGQIHVNWLSPLKIRQTVAVGSRRMAVLDELAEKKLAVHEKGFEGGTLRMRDEGVFFPDIKNDQPLELECRHFLDCIREGKRPLSDARGGLAVVRILAAAEKSMKNNGRWEKTT
jgi:UDP-2-acetamido-3-amino-2,3-dideoxy-glucuronate N-acetyltransferase